MCVFVARHIMIIFVVKADKFYYFCYDITRKSWRDPQIEGFYEMGWIGVIYTYVESLNDHQQFQTEFDQDI